MRRSLIWAGIALATAGAILQGAGRPYSAIAAICIAWIVLTLAVAGTPPEDWTS